LLWTRTVLPTGGNFSGKLQKWPHKILSCRKNQRPIFFKDFINKKMEDNWLIITSINVVYHILEWHKRKGRGAQAEQSDHVCWAYKQCHIAKRASDTKYTNFFIWAYDILCMKLATRYYVVWMPDVNNYLALPARLCLSYCLTRVYFILT
jgi:hypothetical protein